MSEKKEKIEVLREKFTNERNSWAEKVKELSSLLANTSSLNELQMKLYNDIMDISMSKAKLVDAIIRINRSIRFFENAIAAGNLEAMELAYDLYYDSNLALREVNSYTDKQRAKELSDLMIAKDYAGGQIRLAKEYIENPEYLLSFGKKKEACQIVKKLNTKNDLTDSTKKILNDLNSGVICKIAG